MLISLIPATSENYICFTDKVMMRYVDFIWLLMTLNAEPVITAALLLIYVSIAAPLITAALVKMSVEFSWPSKC